MTRRWSVLAGLWMVACTGSQPTLVGLDPRPECNERDPVRPTPRQGAAGAWDPVSERFIVQGGDRGLLPEDCTFAPRDLDAGVWAYESDCDSFLQLPDGPGARFRHAAARLDRSLVVFGGQGEAEGGASLFGDTWVLSLDEARWEEAAAPALTPSARAGHGMVSIGDRVILFGGDTSPSALEIVPSNDVWGFDGSQWSEVSTSGAPSPRQFASVSASPDGSTVYVFGGGDERSPFGGFFGDLHALDVASGTWTLLHDGMDDPAPTPRMEATLVHDGAQLLLFAGFDASALGERNDLWAFDLQDRTWALLHAGDVPGEPAVAVCDFPPEFAVVATDVPERRRGAVGAAVDGRLLVSLGVSGCDPLDDVWLWDGVTWVERVAATTGEACLRANDACTSMCQ